MTRQLQSMSSFSWEKYPSFTVCPISISPRNPAAPSPAIIFISVDFPLPLSHDKAAVVFRKMYVKS